MKFGKFEISNYFMGAVAIIIIFYMILYFAYKEDELKAKTEQLKIERNIVQVEEGEKYD